MIFICTFIFYCAVGELAHCLPENTEESFFFFFNLLLNNILSQEIIDLKSISGLLLSDEKGLGEFSLFPLSILTW